MRIQCDIRGSDNKLELEIPFEEREIHDYFQIGCCIYEIIMKQEASLNNEEFAAFMTSLRAAQLPKNQIWREFTPSLVEFIYVLLVLLPDKRFNVKQLLDHDFLTNSGSYISGGSLGENCTILR